MLLDKSGPGSSTLVSARDPKTKSHATPAAVDQRTATGPGRTISTTPISRLTIAPPNQGRQSWLLQQYSEVCQVLPNKNEEEQSRTGQTSNDPECASQSKTKHHPLLQTYCDWKRAPATFHVTGVSILCLTALQRVPPPTRRKAQFRPVR